MTEDATSREQGVDFATIEPILEDIAYPISADELIAEYGDQTIRRTNAEPISLKDLFESMGDRTFESDEELRQGILNVMPQNSVGREGYSDRGGSLPEEDETADEDESF